MKISFLVTFYRQARFVRQSLDSILALEKPAEWELLVGDDGSDDGTAEAVQAYVDRDPDHIRLFVMDREPGKKYVAVERASANRLNLVRHASGDCYCLMDGDDFYSETDFIPEALSVLEARPDVSVVGFDTWIWREGEPERKKAKGRPRPLPVPRKRYLRWQYTHAGACVFRNIHTPENLALLTELGSFDDNDIVLNALGRGKLVRIHRPVYAYRQAEGSVYTSMPPAEQAALNVGGLGVGLRVMGPEWEKDLTVRFATALWMAWFQRNSLRKELDPFKYQAYLDTCRRAGFSRGVRLLRYPELDARERRGVRKWVYGAGLRCLPRAAYAWFRVYVRGKRP